MSISAAGRHALHEPTGRFAGLRDVLTGLSLSEKDLDDGLLVSRIGDLRAQINDLTLALGGAEGWVIGWLTREHASGSVLYAAAKINKSRNGPLDTSPSDPRSRSVIMGRFNGWAGEFLARLAEYEAAGRQPAVVAPWLVATDACRDDASRVA